MTTQRRKVRYALVGVGNIAQKAVIPGFKNARKNSELIALVSGDIQKLKKVSKKHKVPLIYTYDQFEECISSGEIDAVYIATPNTEHQRFAEPAMLKGIHVLCEKPLAEDQESCRSMIQIANHTGMQAMVGYRLHFDPTNLKVIEIAQSNKIGEIRFFSSIFSYNIQDIENIRLQQDKAGGPLHDIGIYCINAARYLFRAEPYEVFAFSATRPDDKRFQEVDEMFSVVMKFPEHRLAQFTCSFGAVATSCYDLVGTKGRVTLEPAYAYAEPMEMTVTIQGKIKKTKYAQHDQFGAELSYFSDCILKNRTPEPSFTEGLADIVVVEAILESLQRKVPIKVQPVNKTTRPKPSQGIRKPAVSEPDLVQARSPRSN